VFSLYSAKSLVGLEFEKVATRVTKYSFQQNTKIESVAGEDEHITSKYDASNDKEKHVMC